MIAGRLRELVKFQQPVTVKNQVGGNTTTYQDVITTRASVTYNSGNRINENNEIVMFNTVTFTVRMYHNITNDMIMVWRNQKYRITSINLNVQLQKLDIIGDLINE